MRFAYPFRITDKYIWAWTFRRDAYGGPILHTLRLRRFPNRIILLEHIERED